MSGQLDERGNRYGPGLAPVDIGRLWPGWRVVLTDIPDGGESIVWAHKLILLDRDAPDLHWRIAHAFGHLECDMRCIHLGVWFTEEQEQLADMAADVIFDRIDWSTVNVEPAMN